MARYVICKVTELPVGSRKIVNLDGRSVGVFNVNNQFYALKNSCPHQGAPLCMGTVTGMTLPSKPGEYIYGREDEIVRCPWHGWEFDVLTGKSVYDPHKCLVKTYEVAVETEEETQSVETYTVTVEEEKVVVYL